MGKRGLCFKTPTLCPLLSTPHLCPCRGGAVAGECGQPGGRGALRACDKGFVSAEPRGRLVLLLLTEALQRWCLLPARAQPPGTPCERAPAAAREQPPSPASLLCQEGTMQAVCPGSSLGWARVAGTKELL